MCVAKSTPASRASLVAVAQPVSGEKSLFPIFIAPIWCGFFFAFIVTSPSQSRFVVPTGKLLPAYVGLPMLSRPAYSGGVSDLLLRTFIIAGVGFPLSKSTKSGLVWISNSTAPPSSGGESSGAPAAVLRRGPPRLSLEFFLGVYGGGSF